MKIDLPFERQPEILLARVGACCVDMRLAGSGQYATSSLFVAPFARLDS